MKRNRILIFLLALVVVVAAVGCGPKLTPKQRLEEAFTKSKDITSSEADFNMNFKLDLGEQPDSMLGMILGMLEDVQMKGNTKTLLQDNGTPLMSFAGSATTAGVTYDAELFMNEKQMALKIPMLPQYLVQELPETQAMDKEQSMAMVDEVYKVVLGQIDEDKLVLTEGVEMVVGETTVKGDKIAFSMTDAEAKDFTKKMMDALFNNETFVNMSIDQQKAQMEAMGYTVTDEELRAEFEESKKMFDENWNEAVGSLNITKMDMSYLLDKDNQAIGATVDMDMAITDEQAGLEMKVHMDLESVNTMINQLKAEDIAFPELNEENSMPMEQLLNNM